MFELAAVEIGKHYANKWLFNNISFKLKTGESLAICGANGSGKSTLIKIIMGYIEPNKGSVLVNGSANYKEDAIFSLTAPYLHLPQEFSVEEIYQLYNKTNKLAYSLEVFKDKLQLMQTKSPIKHFSSGMYQRLKTALCLLSTHPIKLLDEPLSNMDAAGQEWYYQLINDITSKSIIIVSGNEEKERIGISNQILIGAKER